MDLLAQPIPFGLEGLLGNNVMVDGTSWIVAFHKQMMILGGCNSGECHQTSPHYNTDTTLGNLCQSLVYLHWLVEELNTLDLPPNDFDEKSKRQYRAAHKSAISYFQKKNVFHSIGSLTGQHVLSLLIRANVIRHPTLANYTCFHPNTKSYERLQTMVGRPKEEVKAGPRNTASS